MDVLEDFEKDEDIEDSTPSKVNYTLPYEKKLSKPFRFASRQIDTIILKNELRVEDIQHLPVGKELRVGHIIPIVAAMAGESKELIRQIAITDFKDLRDVLIYFLASGL